MHQITDDDALIMNATFAHKRVRVVQLLAFGLLGFLLAFLGSFYVQSTCHFASSEVVIGSSSEVFVLHYGLWKYSPIDSAFEGYSYCTNYDDEYTSDAPLISRIAGIVGLVAGSYALTVLWFYLILGKASYKLWGWAVAMAFIAGVAQGLTYLFFLGDVCQRNTCTLGPGAQVGIVSTLTWFLVAFEMYYNMPTSIMMTHINPGGTGATVMSNLEMADFSEGASAYIRRMDAGNDGLPTLNEIQRRKDVSSVGRGMMDGNSVRRGGTYKPPTYEYDETYSM